MNGKPALFSRVPPAIFPPMLGLLGIGLGWRQAAVQLWAPPALGEAFLGAVSALFVFGLVAYGMKLARRPGVLLEEVRILPGRAGLSAMSASLFLLAAVFVPYNQGIATGILIAGLIAHAIVALSILSFFRVGPAEQRRVTPVWHLSFVGFIIAPLAAVPLGFGDLATVIFWGTLPVALFIWGASLRQLLRADVPAPLRPLLAIHLAPVCLFGLVSGLLGYSAFQVAFAGLALAGLAALLGLARWLMAAPFSALWGAFTFPMAAFANLMLSVGLPGFGVIGGLALGASTASVVAISAKVLQLWVKGKLAVATNAAQA